MTDQPANITMRLALEQAALRDSQQGVDRLNKALVDLKKTAQEAGVSADRQLHTMADAFKDNNSQIASTNALLSKMRQQLGEIGTEGKKAATSFNVEGIRRTGGALNALGLGAVGQPVSIVGDLAQVGKELKTMGDAAKTLPAVISATTVAIGGMEIALTPILAVLGGVALAVGAAVVAFKLFDDAAQKAAEDAEKAYQADKKRWLQQEQNRQSAEGLTGTELDKKVKITGEDIEAANKHLLELQQLKADTDKKYADLGAAFNPARRDELGKLGTQQQKDIEDWMKHLQDLQEDFRNQTEDLAPLVKAHDDYNKKLEDEKKAQQERDQAADKTIQLILQEAQLKETASSKSIELTIAGMKTEQQAIQMALAKGGLSDEEITKLKARLADLTTQEADYTNVVLPAVKAREAETDAIKRNEEALKKEAEERTRQDEAIASAYEKYQSRLADIEDQSNEKRAASLQKYNDALVAAAEKAVEAANTALQKLEERRQDLSSELGRDLIKSEREAADTRLTDQIKSQRQERDDLIGHLRKLKEIQSSNQADEQQAVWDRNALALIKLRLSRTQQMEAENTAYAQKRQDAQRAANDEISDQQRQQAIARRERLIAYQQANADAQKQYQRELSSIAQAKQKEIQLAKEAQVKELNALTATKKQQLDLARETAIKEIKLASQTADARMKLLLAERDKALELAGMTQSGAGTSKIYHTTGGVVHSNFAGGGLMRAMQVGQVNEPGSSGREGWNGQPFPGRGLWIPLQSGTVNPDLGNRQVTNHLNVTINGGDVGMIRREIESAFEKVMN